MKPTVIATGAEMTTPVADVTGVTATMTGATETSSETSGVDMTTAMARGAKEIIGGCRATAIITAMTDGAVTRMEIADGVTETPFSTAGAIENMGAIAAMMTGIEIGVNGTIASAVGMAGITIAGIGTTIGVTGTTIAGMIARNEADARST